MEQTPAHCRGREVKSVRLLCSQVLLKYLCHGYCSFLTGERVHRVRTRLSRLLGEGLQQQLITSYPSQHRLVGSSSSLAVLLISLLTHHTLDVSSFFFLYNASSAIMYIKSWDNFPIAIDFHQIFRIASEILLSIHIAEEAVKWILKSN